MLSKFEKFALSKVEQGEIKAGISCLITLNYKETVESLWDTIQLYGECSGNSAYDCVSYGQQNCGALYYFGQFSDVNCQVACS